MLVSALSDAPTGHPAIPPPTNPACSHPFTSHPTHVRDPLPSGVVHHDPGHSDTLIYITVWCVCTDQVPGGDVMVKTGGPEAIDATHLVDVLRGSLVCPDFTEIVFMLDLLEMLDVDIGDSEKAKAQGWELDNFQIKIIHIKDRFAKPTSGGWADTMVNFTFAHGDDTRHVMELQIQVRVRVRVRIGLRLRLRLQV